MKQKLLLLEDVDGLGRSGDIVAAKPGFIRNYLLPQKKAIIAQKHTIRLQEKLKEERTKRAAADKKDAEEIARVLEGKTLETKTKVDKEGHMYGSVTAQDIVTLMHEQFAMTIEKRNVVMPKPIKTIGLHEIVLKLKEGVPATVALQIVAEVQEVEE